MKRRAANAGAIALALATALATAGCGAGTRRADPRLALSHLLGDLAGGNVHALCAGLTPGAVQQLAVEFGDGGCTATATSAVRYVASSPGERRALAHAAILPALGLPLSPAPYRTGDNAVRVRVRFKDPVLGARQFVDLSLRYGAGRWKVSGGLDALFTILS